MLQLYSSSSSSRFPSELSIPLNNRDSTFIHHDQNALNSTNSPSNNLVVYVTRLYIENDTWLSSIKYIIADHRFQPVDSEWREHISKKLGFQTGQPYDVQQSNKILKSPKYNEDVKVTKDKNEFFRIISLLFSGIEENYEILRNKVFETIINTNYVIKLLGDEFSVNEYFRTGTKNTDTVKMLATSFVIETCIYIYVKAMGKWLYLPIEFHKENFSKIHEEKCIYLYDEGTHFFIVEDVAD
ncbi:uncharacterized protein LOC126909337 isoform X1 [Daktulosphaira vitifoliae]|uniref:uncharacterized protein LOC126909337 isoform X1 n=1 Tax=Daktulosphaira vitifoliae TaxID=58002 RepID=UPI0021AAB5C8|nr:uncharacterized protein LOC126909337 isoform X1 [Daktulosphaira vitifoliae]